MKSLRLHEVQYHVISGFFSFAVMLQLYQFAFIISFGGECEEFVKCRGRFWCLRIGNNQIPAQVFGKWADTDIERNVM